MRRFLPLIAVALVGMSACSRQESDSAAHDAGRKVHEADRELQKDADSAARKIGKAAHEVAIETKEAAKKADRALEKTAKEVREGWKEGQRDDQSKDKK
jgi:hypothetical protein